ncbi:MAG: hypothetical protein OEV91_09480, partial [Desulfobulbaceae bacterium]|nr:hypothetical protein [Desulfobulbaceae bacterium]
MRVAIILILCGFGITPVLLAVAFNAPAVFGRLEQAAQQESLAVLQREQCALQMRVERIKERIGSLATLPGARDILGLGGADAIALETARSRFSGLVNRWYGKSREVLDIRLTDSSGREYLHLARNKGGKLAVMDDAGQPHPEPAEFIRRGVLLPAGEVLVSEIEVDHGVAAEDLPHVYALSLVTPVVVEGQTAGMLFCRINLTDFLKDYTRSHLWLSGAGGELHQHDASGTHHHAAGEYKAGGERFPGLPAMLKGNEAVIWQGQDRSKVAWQPVLFNGGGPATLWLGHLVDRTVMDRWQREQRFKVLAIVLGLVVVVILLARRIGLFVDRRQGELLTGLENMLAGDRAVAFSWGYVRELKQLASELNGLGERYRDMRFARERAEAELREQNNRLGEMVDRRTAELFATNEQLSEEVEERMQVEEELLRHRHHLEELVRHRVSELAETNEHLQLEILRRQKAQDALAENEARVRAILDSVDIGIIIV